MWFRKKTKIWHIERTLDEHVDYDEYVAFIVRAVDEVSARQLAALEDERNSDAWLNPIRSSAVVVENNGEPGVILADYKAG